MQEFVKVMKALSDPNRVKILKLLQQRSLCVCELQCALPGPLNMAVDEALLQLHVPGESQPVLRFYRWSPPAVSLGYFQKLRTIDLSACGDLGLDVVRRPTGGRAVLHESDLTYSIVADCRQGIPSSLDGAYRLLGVEAELGHEKPRSLKSEICFVRAAVADIVHEEKKFVGSAQTWQGASLLQHGSIVLEPQENTWAAIIKTDSHSLNSVREKLKSRTVSLQEILGRRIEPCELKQAIRAGMAEALDVDIRPGELRHHEWGLAQEIASAKTLSGEVNSNEKQA